MAFHARLRRRLLLLLIAVAVVAVALVGDTAARDPPPVSVLAAVFRGSGCRRPDDVRFRLTFDATGGYITVGFATPFAVAAGASGRTVRFACNGVIPLDIQPGKRIGITQVRVAGHVVAASAASTALVTTEFFFPGERGPTTHKRFLYEDGTQEAFELVDATGTVWSRCGGKQTFRVNTALLASGENTEIMMMDDHGDGLQYEVTVKDCVPNARKEL